MCERENGNLNRGVTQTGSPTGTKSVEKVWARGKNSRNWCLFQYLFLKGSGYFDDVLELSHIDESLQDDCWMLLSQSHFSMI